MINLFSAEACETALEQILDSNSLDITKYLVVDWEFERMSPIPFVHLVQQILSLKDMDEGTKLSLMRPLIEISRHARESNEDLHDFMKREHPTPDKSIRSSFYAWITIECVNHAEVRLFPAFFQPAERQKTQPDQQQLSHNSNGAQEDCAQAKSNEAVGKTGCCLVM